MNFVSFSCLTIDLAEVKSLALATEWKLENNLFYNFMGEEAEVQRGLTFLKTQISGSDLPVYQLCFLLTNNRNQL